MTILEKLSKIRLIANRQIENDDFWKIVRNMSNRESPNRKWRFLKNCQNCVKSRIAKRSWGGAKSKNLRRSEKELRRSWGGESRFAICRIFTIFKKSSFSISRFTIRHIFDNYQKIVICDFAIRDSTHFWQLSKNLHFWYRDSRFDAFLQFSKNRHFWYRGSRFIAFLTIIKKSLFSISRFAIWRISNNF